jgi:epoxyqueuosine reductase
MDEAAFTDRFQGTALRRAGRNRFVRNVAVALGNLRDPRAIPGLRRALLEDPDRSVRGHAAWALGRIATSCAVEALREAAALTRDAEVLGEIEYALGTTTGDLSPLHATPGR